MFHAFPLSSHTASQPNTGRLSSDTYHVNIPSPPRKRKPIYETMQVRSIGDRVRQISTKTIPTSTELYLKRFEDKGRDFEDYQSKEAQFEKELKVSCTLFVVSVWWRCKNSLSRRSLAVENKPYSRTHLLFHPEHSFPLYQALTNACHSQTARKRKSKACPIGQYSPFPSRAQKITWRHWSPEMDRKPS